MVIHRVGPYGNWYEVSDPNEIRARVELITFTPMHLLVQARRTALRPVFSTAPQQSDYTVLWNEAQDKQTGKLAVRKPRFPRLARLVSALRTGMEFYRRQSLRNRRCFRKAARE
jgi:hypothetical protein